MIKAVTLDFWSTLFKENEFFLENQRKEIVLKALLVKGIFDMTIVDQAFSQAWKHFKKRWLMRKISMTSSNFLAYICNYFNIKLENDSFLNTVKELEELSVKNLARPVSGAVETLGKISLNYPDIKLAIISDTGFTPGSGLREILKKNRMIDFFQYLAFSDEIKRSKPSKKIFYAVYDALGVAPEDTIHMGDLEETDIRGAKMWGAKAVLFTGEKKGSTLPAQTGADYVINSFPELYNVVKYNF